jgi:alpha-glucosidase
MVRLLFAGLLIMLIAVAPVQAQNMAQSLAAASSPDKSITVSVGIDNDGRVQYSIKRNEKPLIAPSFMGFLLSDSYAMVRGFAFDGEPVTASGDEKWEQPWGERRFVRNQYNEMLVGLWRFGSVSSITALAFGMKSPISPI